MVRVNIKPLSVNKAWQGRRFKTEYYKSFEKELLYKLPALKMPSPPYRLVLRFGFSNKLSDCSNPIKLVEDIIQKKYGINDRDVYKIEAEKFIVPKGKEFIDFFIETYLVS